MSARETVPRSSINFKSDLPTDCKQIFTISSMQHLTDITPHLLTISFTDRHLLCKHFCRKTDDRSRHLSARIETTADACVTRQIFVNIWPIWSFCRRIGQSYSERPLILIQIQLMFCNKFVSMKFVCVIEKQLLFGRRPQLQTRIMSIKITIFKFQFLSPTQAIPSLINIQCYLRTICVNARNYSSGDRRPLEMRYTLNNA